MSTTLIAETYVYVIEHAQGSSIGELRVSSGHSSWILEVEGWGGLAFGSGPAGAYAWTARSLIGFSSTDESCSKIAMVDDDITFAFARGSDFVLVCETSIRLLRNGRELSRLELGDVVEEAHWDLDTLVADSGGHRYAVTMGADALVINGGPLA
jgi:hypothetical protein